MTVKLLNEHHLECLSLKGGCRGSSESTHVKMPLCLKSHALAHFQNGVWAFLRVQQVQNGVNLFKVSFFLSKALIYYRKKLD